MEGAAKRSGGYRGLILSVFGSESMYPCYTSAPALSGVSAAPGALLFPEGAGPLRHSHCSG